jgi:hypothetical protein
MPEANGNVRNYGKWSNDAFELKYPKGRDFLGGDLLGQTLKALGVEVAFGCATASLMKPADRAIVFTADSELSGKGLEPMLT